MKWKSKKTWRACFAFFMVLCLTWLNIGQYLPANKALASDNNVKSYTVEFDNVTNGFFCNETAATGPITLTYTVESLTTTSGKNGMVATTTPEEEYPYHSTRGSLKYYNYNQMLQEGGTYSIQMEVNQEAGTNFKGLFTDVNDGTIKIPGSGHAWDDAQGNEACQYYGIYIEGATKVKLVNVTCVDGEGNNLGLQANKNGITITENVQEEETGTTYTVEFDNVTNGFFCNETAATGPITLTYTVETLTSTSGKNGMVATTTPEEEYPYVGTRGSLKYYNHNQMLQEGGTYSIQMEVNQEAGTNFKGLFTDVNDGTIKIPASGHAWDDAQGNEACQYYGIYIEGATTVRLVNVTCVDAEGNDLGLQANKSGITITQNGQQEGEGEGGGAEDTAVTYTVEFNDVTNAFICNETAATGPITLTYTVESLTNTSGKNGMVATTTPEEEYPYVGDRGSLKYYNHNQMLQEGGTYSIQMEVNQEEGTNYKGLFTDVNDGTVKIPAGGHAWDDANGNEACQYYGIYIEGATTAKLVNVTCVDAEGNDLGIWAYKSAITVTKDGEPNEGGGGETPEPEQPEPEQPLEQKTPEELGYQRVTIADFQLPEGTYKETIFNGAYTGDTLDKKYLDVNVETEPTATLQGAFISFAGNNAEGWLGIRVLKLGDRFVVGSTTAWNGSAVKEIFLDSVDMEAEETSYNMKLGVQVSENDVIVDLWINDIRVPQMKFKNGAAEFGKRMGVYANGVDITLSTPGSQSGGKAETLPDFKYITLGNFGIEDGTYSNTFRDGSYAFRLHKVIFTADVEFSSGPSDDFRYGSKVDGWHGLRFWTKNGQMYMEDVDGYTSTYVFNSVGAGVTLEDTAYNFKLSTEYVDSDGDGLKDDVKLGVWFNDKLYENKYIYLTDYVSHLGRWIGVYSAAEGEYVKISSVAGIPTGVDYTLFGFTKNWRKEIGIE